MTTLQKIVAGALLIMGTTTAHTKPKELSNTNLEVGKQNFTVNCFLFPPNHQNALVYPKKTIQTGTGQQTITFETGPEKTTSLTQTITKKPNEVRITVGKPTISSFARVLELNFQSSEMTGTKLWFLRPTTPTKNGKPSWLTAKTRTHAKGFTLAQPSGECLSVVASQPVPIVFTRRGSLMEFRLGYPGDKNETVTIRSWKKIPKFKKEPNKKPNKLKVKASAYSYGAKCNGKWAKRNAIGGQLKSGKVNSASADWAKFPLGTKFRVQETGQVYEVDDYGSALVGKNKVDLYMTDYQKVSRWGIRTVTLEIIEWGNHKKSLAVLEPRKKAGYIRQMVNSLKTIVNKT